MHSNSLIRFSGVSVDGRQTHVHPAAKAGAILRPCRNSGKFHGEIIAQTPIGWWNTNSRLLRKCEGTISP